MTVPFDTKRQDFNCKRRSILFSFEVCKAKGRKRRRKIRKIQQKTATRRRKWSMRSLAIQSFSIWMVVEGKTGGTLTDSSCIWSDRASGGYEFSSHILFHPHGFLRSTCSISRFPMFLPSSTIECKTRGSSTIECNTGVKCKDRDSNPNSNTTIWNLINL